MDIESQDSGAELMSDLDQMLVRPGTYFNPQTEVVVVVDDSASIDQEIFNMEAYEGADWIRVSDDVPIDEDGRDAALTEFQTRHIASEGGSLSSTLGHDDDGDDASGDDEADAPRE